jgi:hemoglobin
MPQPWYKESEMKRTRLISTLVGLGILLASAAVAAAGNAQVGSAKSMFCSGCHGVDGNASYVSIRLAGQPVQRLHQTQQAFKTGKRLHPVMNILSLGLTDQDAQDLAMFYAGQKPASLETASLFWRLGGVDAINAAVDETIKVSKADPRLAGRLSGACAAKLKEQLCAATGGPCTYTGRDMKTAHTGLKITAAEFGAVAQNLVGVLNAFNVPEKEKNELVGLIAPMQGMIVGQ